MKLACLVTITTLAIILNGCVAHAPRTCSSKGYKKGSPEYQECIKAEQQENYYRGSGIGGGGP
jgi:hypothetical protein